MTDEMMSLQNLLGKSAGADFLREVIGFAAQRLTDLEVEGLTGAGHDGSLLRHSVGHDLSWA